MAYGPALSLVYCLTICTWFNQANATVHASATLWAIVALILYITSSIQAIQLRIHTLPTEIKPQTSVLEQGTVVSDSEVPTIDQKLRSQNTAILADTLHFETLSLHDLDGTMLNLKKVIEAVTCRKLDYFVWVATKKVFDQWSGEKTSKTPASSTLTRRDHVLRVIEQLFVELAMTIGDRVAGPHVGFIDPREHGDVHALVESAQRMFDLFRSQGVSRQAIILSIPATEAGIRAAQLLKKERKINVNLYLVTSVVHAEVCVEAGAAAITIPVGPLLRRYEAKRRTLARVSPLHPGIEAIETILEYVKHNDVSTRVIGTAFRNMAEIDLLSNFDAVCLSPAQLEKLRWPVPISSSLEKTELNAKFRARQAKYPTDMLTKPGDFSTWFSPESRRLTSDFLHDALTEMQGQMEILEAFVEQEVVQQFEIDTMDLRELLVRWRREDDTETSANETENSIDRPCPESRRDVDEKRLRKELRARSASRQNREQDMNDIF